MYLKPLAFLAPLASGLTEATQIFSNRGTVTGWDAIYIDQGTSGSVQNVTNVIYEPDTALKMTQTYIPSGYTGRYHSEVHKYNVYKKGDTGFYGFMFRLASDWQFEPVQSYNLAQFIADFTDLPCEEDYMPSSMIWLLGDQLQSRVKNGNVCPTKEQHIDDFKNLTTVTRGEWHKIVIQASWKSDETGYYKIWYDGESVLNRTGIKTTVTDGRYFQFRVGLYADGWFDDKGMKGTQGFRQVWFDEIAAGTRFADADPDQW